MTSVQNIPKAGRREWTGLAVIALPCLVYAMDLTVLNLALPAISTDLAPSAAEMLWIIDIYGFMVAGLLITMGTLGDRIGRRRLLLAGAAAFALTSVLAAVASSPGTLIAARALLGVAGATLAPSTLSLIRNMFHDEHERQFAIGIWITAFSPGSVAIESRTAFAAREARARRATKSRLAVSTRSATRSAPRTLQTRRARVPMRPAPR